MPVPDEPETGATYRYVMSIWRVACKSRRYTPGLNATPLPLGVAEITSVVEAYGAALSRRVLDEAIFRIDSEVLSEVVASRS